MDQGTYNPEPEASRAGGSSASADAASSMKKDGAELADKATERLAGEADARKGQVATGVKQVSSALDAAQSELEGKDAPAWVTNGLKTVATSVADFADKLENKDSEELLDEVRSFAQARPALFLGTCAAAGFAAARVFTAGLSSGTPQASGIDRDVTPAGSDTKKDQAQGYGASATSTGAPVNADTLSGGGLS